MAELVDALDSKSSSFGSVGSIPTLSTEWGKFSAEGLSFFLLKDLYIYIYQNINIMTKSNAKSYWKENIRYVLILMFFWFLVSFGAGILFKDFLNEFKIGGFKLGFWFAQQGSIYVFVILIFIYVYLMNNLDKKYGYDV